MLDCVFAAKHSYLCAAPHSVLLRKFALFSAQLTLFLSRYANFVYLGFRRLLAYRHLSAVSSPNSVTIGGKCVCAYSIFAECVSGTGFIASLTAGLNIVPITENSPCCLVTARKGMLQLLW